MIRYGLACEHGHEFEGWFGSSADYDGQSERGLIACPVCDSSSSGMIVNGRAPRAWRAASR